MYGEREANIVQMDWKLVELVKDWSYSDPLPPPTTPSGCNLEWKLILIDQFYNNTDNNWCPFDKQIHFEPIY